MLPALIVFWLGGLLLLPSRPSLWITVSLGLPILGVVSVLLARRRGAAWVTFVRETADGHVLALVLLYALGVQMADAHGITTDGVTYFTQLRSAIFDRDLDVEAEYLFLGQPLRPNYVVPVGPVLVWLPLYLAVALVDTLGRTLGLWPAPAESVAIGLGLPYVRAVLMSSFAIGAAGLFALQWHLRQRFAPAVALLAVVLIFGATPLYWYMVYEPSMTHAASFGFVTLFVVCAAAWLKPFSEVAAHGESGAGGPAPLVTPSVRQALVLGTLLGLAFLARSQEAVFAVYPALIVLTATGLAAGVRVRAAARLAGWAFLGALPWILLQLIHSYVLFTRHDYSLFGQGGYFNPLQSRWLDTLFSSWHGFLSWSPVAYVAVVGLVVYLRREWRWAAAGLTLVFMTAWVNGATQDWAAGWSFGGRRFSATLAMLAPGLALVIEATLRRPIVLLAPIVAGALWWNHLLMVQYTAGYLPKDEPVSFGRMVRQQAELHTRSPYWYPFAFPANAWFAWREGLPVDKYDVLAPETPQATFTATFDRAVEKYLLSGWDVPGGDDWGPCWWIGGTPAVLAAPLDLDGTRDVTISIRTRTRFEEPPVQAQLALHVNGHEVGRFDAGLPDATTATLRIPAEAVSRIFRRGFNQIGVRYLGVVPVDANDPRPPGPLARRRGNPVWPVAVYSLDVR